MLYVYFSSGALPISSGAFGDDTMSTIVRSVSCNGSEVGLLDCSYSTVDPGTCSGHSAAVICQGKTLKIGLCVWVYPCVQVI